jgi:hypothetical protein
MSGGDGGLGRALILAVAVGTSAGAVAGPTAERDSSVRLRFNFNPSVRGLTRLEALVVRTKLERELAKTYRSIRLARPGEEPDALLVVEGLSLSRKTDLKRGKTFVDVDVWGHLEVAARRQRLSGRQGLDSSSAYDEERILETAADRFVDEAERGVWRTLDPIYRRRPDWPRIDFEYAELNRERRKGFGVRKGKGPVVTAVTRGGAAARAGLRVGDVIERDGKDRLSSPSELAAAIYRKGPGGTLALTVVRAGDPVSLSYTIPRR